MLLDQVGAAAQEYALPAVELAPGSERFSGGAEHAHEAGYGTTPFVMAQPRLLWHNPVCYGMITCGTVWRSPNLHGMA